MLFPGALCGSLEVSAINGLGSILILERELEAAEFFRALSHSLVPA